MSDAEAQNPVPQIPVGATVERGFDWIQDNLGALIDWISDTLDFLVTGLTELLLIPSTLVGIAIAVVLALLVRSVGFAVLSLAGLLLVASMDMWDPAMQTLSLVLMATALCVVVSVPVGILAARSSTASAIVRPVLDFMQTMPAFVWLVPAIILFSIGAPPAMFATVIFALPPGVRLTELAIRQVDAETVEAGEAFGGTPWQILRGIQLPLGTPTIMAGINQVIMLALSMAVIAGLVGYQGLGQLVTTSISRIDIALGFEAGLAVVVLAIYLDRFTSAIGQPTSHSLIALARKRRTAARAAPGTGTGGAEAAQDDDDAQVAVPAGSRRAVGGM